MYFWISAAAVAACIYWTRKGSAMRIVLLTWAAAIVLPALPLLNYRVDYSVRTDLLVAGCLVLVTLGYRVVRNPAKPAPPPYGPRKERQFAWALAVIGAIGSILLLIDNGAELSVSFLIDNLSTIRAESFDSLAQDTEVSRLALIGGFLAPCSLLAIIAAIKIGGRGLRAAALFNFSLLTLGSLLLLGGRTTIFMAALLAAVSWRLTGRRITLGPRTWAGAAVAAVAVAYFSISWLDTRQGAGFSPESELAITQRAEVYPWARGNQTLATALLSFGYFASPLPSLAFYVEHPPLPGPMGGAYSFPLLAGVWIKANSSGELVRSAQRNEVFAPFEAGGYFGNVWSSLVRDLLVDIRWVGALFFFGISGAFLAWARNRLEQTGATHYHYLETITCYTLAFGAFTSYLPHPMLSIAFFGAFAVMLVTRLSLARPARALTLPGASGSAGLTTRSG